MMNMFLKPGKRVYKVFVILIVCTVFMNILHSTNSSLAYSVYKFAVEEYFTYKYQDYGFIDGDNIRVLYKNGSSSYAEQIADSSRKEMNSLYKDLGWIPEKKLDIIVYPEYEMMSKMMGLGSGSPALGAYYCGTIGIMDSGDYQIKKGLLLHEMTHYAIDCMVDGTIPAWFTEGAALYEEYRVYGSKWADSMKYDECYTMDELEKDFYKLDEIKAYKEAFLIVRYIGDNYGIEAIRKIIEGLEDRQDISKAVFNATNLNIEDIFDKAVLCI